ncbi:GH3 auxin-responsive promoter family protein [Spirosoma sp. KUDC1026]|uniref:GH3 family domain-containing protein n=1 Tax=Spirosoma sp. KUDC1026 TaxID=2745947 RepID=UPI00159BE972|nr:GH3 auxin-responsive promoter family protein [Spirosoma sp. KUDC1026]QKZ13584.1 GH3 auxin-responsive promoter family protein [Spirosoma sp. KUDC1026]
MALLGRMLKNGIRLTNSAVQLRRSNPIRQQRKAFRKLISKAQFTEFGRTYQFDALLSAVETDKSKAFYDLYKQNVPIHDYNRIFDTWWHRALAGERDITWPGRVKYFALSSGTSEAATKYIPVTKTMSKAIQRTSIRQILTLGRYQNLPSTLYEKGYLMLGGSTQLNAREGHYEGDLSGITASKIPFWFQRFYKPGKDIARERDWALKLDEITEQAGNWDIGYVVGVPAWIQLLMEKIIARYNVKTIHDVWPNLMVFCHGGVSFEPYRQGFEKLLAHPITYIETYLASEGFIAYQSHPNAAGMQLVLDNGLFFEFIPFNEQNFSADGELVAKPETLMIDEVQEGKEYALLLSTCSGAWRYLIGDTIRFVDKSKSEIVITGRTKHFLSLCGEHLSVDNMNKALEMTADDLGIAVREFTVAGVPYDTLFAHHWYVGTDDAVDATELRNRLDTHLKDLNDDYATERQHALKEVTVTVLPTATFYDWMNRKGKMGGQHKFPRVLKKALIADWQGFLAERGYAQPHQ